MPSETRDGLSSQDGLTQHCRDTLAAATEYAISSMITDNHWSGEVHSNVTITAEYVFLFCYLELNLDPYREALTKFLYGQQRSDGSWNIAIGHPGDVSLTTEAYLALKILGVDAHSDPMTKARGFILSKGGLSQVRFFTRIYLAMFGLLSWDSVPQLAPELIMLPDVAPISIYRFASWARATLVPLLVIAHHKPVFGLPNGGLQQMTF
jgi:squalene-hopene/tetraprenyl-beta-curcumene cyclase